MKLRYSKNHKALHRLGIIKSKVFPKGLTWLVLNLLRVPKGRNLATLHFVPITPSLSHSMSQLEPFVTNSYSSGQCKYGPMGEDNSVT